MKMTKHEPRLLKQVLFFLLGTVLSFVSLKVFDVIYTEQKYAFIDEIFHVPQAKLYCRNQWSEWNPKITTFPGLYIVSYLFLKPLEQFGYESFCSLYSLRFMNLIATVLNFFLAFQISCLLEKKYKVESKFFYRLLTAFNVAIFPPLYFFTFLYYTDVWSTTFVLLMYYLHLLDGRLAQIIGIFANFMAVLMRQTNIIWVGLLILDDIWNVINENSQTVTVQDFNYSKRVCKKFISEHLNFKNNLRCFLNLTISILSKSFHNILICLLFIIFLIINKSVVLGDKEAHTATFHPMQNLYFLGFVGFFGWPFLIFEVVSLWKKPVNVFLAIFLLGLCAALSEVNKLEHPYLLADNRHIAFYLWKRVFGHNVFRRAIIPIYVNCGILLFRLLQKRCHFMFMVMLSLCTFLNLTPQYLFELRYFIVPFLIYRLQFKTSSAVILENVFFIIINAGIIYLFLNRPFTWPSEPNLKQRFIW